MTEQLVALALSVIGALSIIAGSYYKGRKDKDNENDSKDLKSAKNAKERLEGIKSIDNDDDYIKRVRDNEG